jgi:RND family efflux transporter MFP subunit
VELGDKVKAGQVLARIDDAALRDTVRSAETAVRTTEGDLAMAKRQEERVEKLAQAGALAERDLEVARTQRAGVEARLEDAKAKFAQAREMVAHTVVTSPMDGVVSQQPVHAGDVVSPGAPMFTVIDPSSMRLEASVPSEAVALVAVGTPVQFQVRGYPDPFTGKIERIAPAADPQSRQIPLVITIPNPSGQLLAGLFADGRVMATQHDGLVVPAAAVDQAGKSITVLRVKDGKVDRVQVELGLRDERSERVEVTSGLAEGDVVLLGAARTIAPGTAVRVDVADRTAER